MSTGLDRSFVRLSLLFSIGLVAAAPLEHFPMPSGAQVAHADDRAPVNRAVLGAGTDVYTVFDVQILLALWNIVTDDPVPLSTDWSRARVFLIDREKDLQTNLARWPADAQRLLFIALVAAESKRLNLFVPLEREMNDALNKLQARGRAGESLPGLSPSASAYFASLGKDGLRKYVDVVLRARTSERVRGDFRKNLTLINQPWFWHVEP